MADRLLELRVLGPLQISVGGEPVTGLVSAKAQALLVYLALARRACSRTSLAGLLWSDLPEQDARRNLRVEFQKLRRWFSPYLSFTNQTAALFADSSYWMDALELEHRLLASPASHANRAGEVLWAAADLFRGSFLQDFQVRAAPLFEEWLLIEREHYRQVELNLLDRLARQALQIGDVERGLSVARRLLAIDTWRETSHRHLMALLALSGDRSMALSQFDACRRILVQEFGVEPGPETTALAERIRSGEYPLALSTPGTHASLLSAEPTPAALDSQLTPHNLPAPSSSFIGRDAELDQAESLLGEPDCRLLSLVGPGGIGKTRLALELAWRLKGRPDHPFQDGIYFTSLEAVSEPGLLATTILASLDHPVTGSQDPLEQLIQRLQDRHTLLILDNFEQLNDAAPALIDLLRGVSRLSLVVTTRQRLDLSAEWVLPLEGMPVPRHPDPDEWRHYAALQLFHARARRTNLTFSIDNHLESVTRLCQTLEGMPLGIELAAAWVHALPVAELLKSVEHNLSLPDSRFRDTPARQRSLRAVFESSWDLMREEEQHALTRAAIFRGGFTLTAASAAGIEPRQLASLVTKSMLRLPPDGRYMMHATLQVYAFEHLAPADRMTLHLTHSQYYAIFIGEREARISGPDESEAINEIRVEIDNVRLAWDWVVQALPASGEPISGLPFETALDLLQRFTPMLDQFYNRMSWYREAERVFTHAQSRLEQAIQSEVQIPPGAHQCLGLLILAHGRHVYYLGSNDVARGLLQRSIQLLAEHPPANQLASAYQLLGLIEQNRGAFDAARAAFEQSLDRFRGQQNQTGIAANLVSLGNMAKARGDLEAASSLYTEALHSFRERGDQRGVWTCLINLGNIANVRQDYATARRLYEESHAIIAATSETARQALTLLNLGSVEREIGEFSLALDHYGQSLEVSRAIGEKRIIIGSLDGLGKTYLIQGDLAPARRFLIEALGSAWSAGLVPAALDSLASLARLQMLQGMPESADCLLTLVLDHPACPHHVRLDAQRTQSEYALDASALARVKEFIARHSLESVVEQLLKSQSIPDSAI